MADVARLLMCCQCGEGDQTLSLNTLQLNGQVTAPSHTSALTERACRLAIHMSESRFILDVACNRSRGQLRVSKEALDMPRRKSSREHMTLLHERPRPPSAQRSVIEQPCTPHILFMLLYFTVAIGHRATIRSLASAWGDQPDAFTGRMQLSQNGACFKTSVGKPLPFEGGAECAVGARFVAIL
jgi:hypothetical protein